MKITVSSGSLVKLLQQVKRSGRQGKKGDDILRVWACQGHVFIEANGMVAGTEALVLAEGTCSLRLKGFANLVGIYKNGTNLTLDASPNGLIIGTTKLSITGYSPDAVPPSGFVPQPCVDNSAIVEGLKSPKTP